ncbi:hypothetical protein DS6A_71 [Mycobacterium phage DS6A]|uniref:Uncharacterized protein n=1 Tax=Mycobacterium phage DS6A TaxID=45764 RepID=G8I4I1_9CAUD|nr:hypothetical protein DS6A_71 [Mycobacterium phage DS6A]AER47625.1 hypothetical protein DS6A_71 [Mycobacterium phage DS6A]
MMGSPRPATAGARPGLLDGFDPVGVGAVEGTVTRIRHGLGGAVEVGGFITAGDTLHLRPGAPAVVLTGEALETVRDTMGCGSCDSTQEGLANMQDKLDVLQAEHAAALRELEKLRAQIAEHR